MNENKTETKKYNRSGENYHEVIAKTTRPTNTGPQKIYKTSYQVKWGMVEKWMAQNPRIEVIGIINHEYNN